MNGKEVQNLSVKERKAMGLGYIPSDRHKDAMVPDFSITENFLLGYQEDPKYCKKGFIDYKALEEDAKVQVEQFEIKIAGVSQHIGQLSGGNQQKVCLAKAFALQPRFLFVSEPTRGIDVGAKALVLDALKKFNRENGVTVVMISSELEELRTTCDRIAIVSGGRIVGILPATESSETFGALMVSQVK